MKHLVRTEKNKVITDTLIIAEGVGNHHKNVMALLNNHKHTKTLTTFETAKVSNGGRPVEFAILNETQATFLVTLMKNSEIVVKFKEELSIQFVKRRQVIQQIISQQKDPNWMDVRKDGKVIIKQKSAVIEEFIKYCLDNGSTNAKNYHSNFARMENKAMFIFEQKYPNMREVLTIKQMMQVATGDDIIEKAIKEGMEKEMYYKDIFKLAKDRIIKYVEIIGQSPILGLE